VKLRSQVEINKILFIPKKILFSFQINIEIKIMTHGNNNYDNINKHSKPVSVIVKRIAKNDKIKEIGRMDFRNKLLIMIFKIFITW